MLIPRKMIIVLLALASLFLVSAVARADTINVTAPEFNGTLHNPTDPFPLPSVTVFTFNYVIPAGQQIVSATLSGTFGNSVVSNSSGVDLRLDGLLVGQCVQNATCYTSQSPTAWSFTFAPANFSLLSDGTAVFTAIQTSEFFIRLGVTTLTLNTAAAVPEPVTMLLLGTGLTGVAVKLRRKRKQLK